VTFLAIAPAFASAQLITFETTPGAGIPVDDSFLTTPYALSGGGTVGFYFDNNLSNSFDPGIDTFPVFERTGPDGNNAFTGYLGVSDAPDPLDALQLGDWFLRQSQPGPAPPPFIVDYNTLQTITGLSGEIWDIDGNPSFTEQWVVDVLDASGSVLATQTSPLGDNLAFDARAWTFGFSGLPAGVDKVRLTFTGSKTTGIGLAFNNFSPFTVPEPSTLVLATVALLGGIGLAARRRSTSPPSRLPI
ncbi:MAG: PEP-CTERM sorting domain-containing protein, partial [Planctomycetota bacterium]|nr:PEP-CTERM sorting domain-containing protein [Planctomycetota bacterium]